MEPQTPGLRKKQPSKITVPARAHPFAKLLFAEMRRQNVTYAEQEWKSGVLISTYKAYRGDNSPGLTSIEAALGALGWTLVPVPRLETLPTDLREKLEELGQHFRSDEEVFGAALRAAAEWPGYAEKDLRENFKGPKGIVGRIPSAKTPDYVPRGLPEREAQSA